MTSDPTDWPEGSVRLMQTDRQGQPALLGGAVNMHQAVQRLYELSGSPAFIWAETLLEGRWLPEGSGPSSWREVVTSHVRECAECEVDLRQQLMSQTALRMFGLDAQPEVTVVAGNPNREHYPQTGLHLWNEFAYVAIESGGYGDLTAVNPYSGDRCHTFAFRQDGRYGGQPDDNPYAALRRLIDAMESVDFLATQAANGAESIK